MSEKQSNGNIYDRFAQVTRQTHDLVDSMEQLQNQVTELLEQNAELSIENDHLRRVIKKMKDKNKLEVTCTREELINQGYDPCGRCNP